MADARALNRVVKLALQKAALGIKIRRNLVDLKNCMILTWADSAFANAEDEKSQCGICLGLVPKGEDVHVTGSFERLLPILASSGTVKRVVRSTLAAEAYAVPGGIETAQFLRHVILELLQPPRPGTSVLQAVSKIHGRIPIVCCTDSDNLEKSIESDSGGTKDKRLRIVVAMLREVVEIEPWVKILWINTQRMVADPLTKLDSPLFKLLEDFMASLQATFPKSTKTKQVSTISAWLSYGYDSKVSVNVVDLE